MPVNNNFRVKYNGEWYPANVYVGEGGNWVAAYTYYWDGNGWIGYQEAGQ